MSTGSLSTDLTTTAEELKCDSGQFACRERCIDLAWRCDGETDCIDKVDEQDCPKDCGEKQFCCGENGGVEGFTLKKVQVPKSWVCDGDNDCGDLSDEIGCKGKGSYRYPTKCSLNYKQCDIGTCFPQQYECDCDNDCADRSDESEERCAKKDG